MVLAVRIFILLLRPGEREQFLPSFPGRFASSEHLRDLDEATASLGFGRGIGDHATLRCSRTERDGSNGISAVGSIWSAAAILVWLISVRFGMPIWLSTSFGGGPSFDALVSKLD